MDYTPKIRDLPSGERPRERLRDYGPSALSTGELLAIILRSGSAGESVVTLASRLLSSHQGLVGLARAPFDELVRQRGLGEAKAAQIKAALELGRRLAVAEHEERPVVRSAFDVANLLVTEMSLLDQESLRVVLLNSRNGVISIHEVIRGNVNSAQVRVAEVLREPVRRNAVAVIVVHNHPSGDPTPSGDDLRITQAVVEAAEIFGIEVLDHVIIGNGRYYSMEERGHLPRRQTT